jgi:hypothetical protein
VDVNLKLDDDEWKQLEILLLVLLPFKLCTKRFESNKSEPEIDFVFFAYDRMFNHIEDVKSALQSGKLASIDSAQYVLKSIESMHEKLKGYYSQTGKHAIYVDAMILSPRTKLSIFEADSWSDEDSGVYKMHSRQRYMEEYDGKVSRLYSNKDETELLKRQVTDAFQQTLIERSQKRRRNDFDRYIDIPNDPYLDSSLTWWREHVAEFIDLSRMARAELAVPASGYAIERMFSISGRIIDLAKESFERKDYFRYNDISRPCSAHRAPS